MALKYYQENQELPLVWNNPLYKQMNNSCGLASVLMMIQPEIDLRLLRFLSQLKDLLIPIIYHSIGDSLAQVQEESIFQFVLEYLLLKAQTPHTESWLFLREYLNIRFSFAYSDQIAMNSYRLKQKKEQLKDSRFPEIAQAYDTYLEKGILINPEILRLETETQKTDVELKLIMELMGYKYIPTESGDGTGSLYFTPENAWDKIQQLGQAHIHPFQQILYGFGSHWTVVTGFYPKTKKHWRLKHNQLPKKISPRDYLITYNDPILPAQKSHVLKGITPSQRFYVFENRQENLQWLWSQIIDAIKMDIVKETPEIKENNIINEFVQ